jgi:outer membrane autotransporter protein
MFMQQILRIHSWLLGAVVIGSFVSQGVFAQTGGCPSAILTTGNQSITCSTTATSSAPVTSAIAISTYSTTSQPPSGSPPLSSTAYDGVSALVTRYTTVQLSGSPIGLASGSSATNYGTLSSNSFTYGYGISFGANGRTNTGGNTVLNGSTGQITTAGGNANGIYIAPTSASARGNSITNDGIITTNNTSTGSAAAISLKSGATSSAIVNTIINTGALTTLGDGSYGIEFTSVSGVNTVNNSGSITTSGSAAHGMSITSTRNTVGVTNSGTISTLGAGTNGIDISGAANISNSGTISSASGLAIKFGGTLPSNAFNSLSINNGSVINGGIAFNSASTRESLTFNGYTNSDFNNAITGLNIINASNSSNVVMSSSAGYDLVSGQVAVDASSALSISGVVRDQASPAVASSLTKTGAGGLTLSGSNTYTGGTNLSAGTIAVGSNTALGTGSLAMADGTTLQAAANNIALANSVSVAGISTVDTNSNNLSLSGNVTGAGGVTKIGAGVLTLSGSGNSYSGATNVNAGTLKSSAAGAFSSNSAFVVSTGATLDLNGYSQVIGSLAGAGSTSLGPGNLTAGGNNTSTTFSGSIDGSGSINKVGAGTLSLTGANTYTGGTSLNAGTIAVGNNAALGTNDLAMAAGTTLQAASSVSLANAVDLAGAANIDTNGNNLGLSGVISGVGAVTKTGAGTLTLTGANTYAGGTTVSAGTLVGNATSVQGNIINNAIVDFNQAAAGTYAGTMSGTGSLVKEGAGTLTLAGPNSYSGGTTVSAGTLAGNAASVQGDIANSGTVQFTQVAAGAYAGTMSGTGSLIKEGSATLTLTGPNTYTGGTNLNAGTIAVGNNAALGAGGLAMATGTTLQAASSVALANAISTTGTATVDTNANNLGLSGVISGSGALTKVGAGTLTLSGANTYSGGTSLDAGTIAVGNNAALGTGSLTMAADTTLQAASSVVLANAVAASGAVTINTNGNNLGISGVISGVGSVNKTGAGTLTLSGANTYAGDTNLNAGNLILTGSIGSIGSNANTAVAVGATLQGGGIINGNVSNAGNIEPSYLGVATQLTINGNYVGNNGSFTTNVWGPNTSPTADVLKINGGASGSTGITVVDKGGLGNRTSGDGIQVVQVNGVSGSTSNAFALNQRVASGAFEYQLVKGSATGSGNSWYLRTDNPADPASVAIPPPVVPITPAVGERIEVSVYPALPSLIQMYAQTAVDTLDQRRGDLNLVDPSSFNQKKSNDWARIIGKTGTSTPSNIGDGPKLNFNAYALQFGVDLYKNEELAGSRTYVGPYVTIGGANGNTSNQAGTTSTGNINGMQAYSLGLYGTHFAENGLYIDALAQGSRYLNANASSVQGAGLKTQGSGFTGSLEAGGRWNMTEKFLISPQAQIVYDAIGMSNASDAYGQINFNKSEISRRRFGILAGHKDTLASTPIFAYLRANYWSVFNAGTSTTFQSLYGVNPITFQSQTGSRWLALDAEVNARLTKSTNLFLNLGWENSLVGTYQAISGRVGLQTRF